MDALLAKTGGDISLIEAELGIPTNRWNDLINDPADPTTLVRVDIPDPIGVRMAKGTEQGADKNLWLPGGKTPKGWDEAIINPIPKTDVSRYKIIDIITI